jgi:hypothetical protein
MVTAAPKPSVSQQALNLLRTGGPMTAEELTAELSAFCRAKLVDAEWVSQTDVERVLDLLGKKGDACVDGGKWDWVPPQAKPVSVQMALFA